jgi:sulfonate transport system permease protein
MLQAVPFPAILPVFVLWLGLGEASKVAFIALATAFPMYLNTFAGIRGVDHKYIEAARVLGLRKGAIVKEVIFPASLPAMLVGLRYSILYSVLALVIAETLNATSGIGYLITEAQQFIRTDELMAAAVIYAVIGVTGEALVRLLERLLVPWARTFKGA